MIRQGECIGLSLEDEQPRDDEASLEGLVSQHERLQRLIEQRLSEFSKIGRAADDQRLFEELAFCLLTPQSRARRCWAAVELLSEKGLLPSGHPEDIHPLLVGVRFKYTKARRICQARTLFHREEGSALRNALDLGDPREIREWLVENVNGMGYKEASHFLRNIGRGGDLAILDRHILKNLVRYGVIPEVPRTLNRKRYLEIEEQMRSFAAKLGIPMDHLDFVLWYREAGEIFK